MKEEAKSTIGTIGAILTGLAASFYLIGSIAKLLLQ